MRGAEKVRDVADRFEQALRRRSLLDEMLRQPHEGEPEFALGNLIDAMPLILKHHYSRRRTADPMFVFLWRYGNDVMACAVFTSPSNKFFGEGAVELARLVRIPGFQSHLLSRFVALCLRWLRRNTDLRYCLSYADMDQGHYGYIYQACNFTFVAESKGHQVWQNRATGRIVSNRSFDQQTDRAGWDKVRTGRKLLYVYPINERLKSLLGRFGWTPLPYRKADA